MGGSTAPSTFLGGGSFRGGGATGGEPCHPFRPVHPRLSPPQPPLHYLYTAAPSTLHPVSYPSTYPGPPRQSPVVVGDYVIGHAVTAGDAALMQQQPAHRGGGGGYCCFGAPLTTTTAPPPAATAAAAPAAVGMNVMQDDKANCNCSFGGGGHSRNNNVNTSS